jgi:hypothetical protein
MGFLEWMAWSLVTLVGVGLLIWLSIGLRAYFRYRGERLVVCPETQKPAAVDVAAGRAARQALGGKLELRLSDCSRWPERAGCGQDCLSQVEADPGSCLVWNIVARWYADKTCALCGKPFGEVHWHDHRPALLDAEMRTVQWTEIAPENLPAVFATHWPVCWNCHIAESFRRQHPELITNRPPH